MRLAKGSNTVAPGVSIAVECAWTEDESSTADLSCLLLTDGRVRTDEDFVFYNQTTHPSGSVEHLGKRMNGNVVTDAVRVELGAVPSVVDSLAVVLSFDGPSGAGLRALEPIEVTVRPTAETGLVEFSVEGLSDETAAVTVELYRRADQWKVRAVGQGYFDGLGGLARDFGVSVDDESDSDPSYSEADSESAPSVDWRNPPVPHGYV